MVEEKKSAGRPKERPDGEVSLKNRLPRNLYRVLKGVSGLRGLSMNDAVIEAVELWAKQYPAFVAVVEQESINEGQQNSRQQEEKAAPSKAGSVNKTNPQKPPKGAKTKK